MNKGISLSVSGTVTAIGLIVAACGILTQIFAGIGSTPIPVGAIVMLIIAGLIFARFWRWAPTLGAVIAFLILVGAFIAPGLGKRLSNPSELGPFVGTVLQLLGLATAIIAGSIATREHFNGRNKAIRAKA